MNTIAILDWMWGAFGVYWLVRAWGTGNSLTHEQPLWRLSRLLILALTFILLLSPWLRIGLLAERFVPDARITQAMGLILTAAGILLAVWARWHLGKFWSDKIVLKVDHRLIRSGPYAHLRHPIYSGVLLGIAGTALAIGEWRGLLALAVLGTNYFMKARQEERILAAQFGETFAEYRRHAGFVLPRW